MNNTSQWATDLRTERHQTYDPHPVVDWFADQDDSVEDYCGDPDDPACGPDLGRPWCRYHNYGE